MKKLTKLLSLLLVFALALSAIACSSSGKIERLLKDDGYTLLVDKLDSQKKYEKVDGVNKVHVFTKTKTVNNLPQPCLVFVLEFKSTDKMIKHFNENDSLKTIVKDITKNDDVNKIHSKLEKAGLACDDCLIVTIEDPSIYKKIAELNN